MELQEELELYKKALIDFENNAPFTDDCFCEYFFRVHGLSLYGGYFELYLPYLYKQKPNNNKAYLSYWFPEGELNPRIECLKKAIAEIETILNK